MSLSSVHKSSHAPHANLARIITNISYGRLREEYLFAIKENPRRNYCMTRYFYEINDKAVLKIENGEELAYKRHNCLNCT